MYRRGVPQNIHSPLNLGVVPDTPARKQTAFVPTWRNTPYWPRHLPRWGHFCAIASRST
jgi:hypothetical protein